MYQFYFERLRVWQESKDLAGHIYQMTTNFPTDERFNLTDQMRRSAVSVCANIAEGSTRSTNKDKVHFTNMAYSSLMELYSFILICNDLKRLGNEDLNSLKTSIHKIANLLNSLRKAQVKFKSIKSI